MVAFIDAHRETYGVEPSGSGAPIDGSMERRRSGNSSGAAAAGTELSGHTILPPTWGRGRDSANGATPGRPLQKLVLRRVDLPE